MDLAKFLDLAMHNGFALVFAVWALIRLDRFLVKLVETEAKEAEMFERIIANTERDRTKS